MNCRKPARLLPLAGLAGLFVVALAVRLQGIAFGLPSLYDPDEPIFVLTAMKLLRDHTLNPQWFGHPATTTIYAIALIEGLSFLAQLLTGRITGPQDLVAKAFADPSILFLPARYFTVACGLAVILCTWLVAQRLDHKGGRPWIAAALVAVMPIMVKYSQIVRSDMHATIFGLLVVYAALRILAEGRMRDYAIAGLCLGFGVATKWPTAVFAAGVGFSALARVIDHRDRPGRALTGLVLFGTVSLAGLFVASPYLFLDYRQVISDLSGEVQNRHLGATGFGFLGNVQWYLQSVALRSLGLASALLAGLGMMFALRDQPGFRVVILPTVLLLLVALALQNIVWERWMVPFMPFAAIAVADGVAGLAEWAGRATGGRTVRPVTVALALLAGLAPVQGLVAYAHERDTDTRRLAADWLRDHAPPGSVITLEHMEFTLLPRPFEFRFPLGDAGCLDVRKALASRITNAQVGRWRGKRTIIDLGTVNPDMIDSCVGNFALLMNYDRYVAEAAQYPAELANYRHLIARGRIVATFRPEPGRVGGPTSRIVRFGAAPGAERLTEGRTGS